MTKRSTISKHIKTEYRRASRALGFALIRGDCDGWADTRLIWAARLTTGERAAMAYASLTALCPEQQAMVVGAALSGAGEPQAPFLSVMDQAAFWADMAESEELDAYLLAAFNRLSPSKQCAFLDFVNRRAA